MHIHALTRRRALARSRERGKPHFKASGFKAVYIAVAYAPLATRMRGISPSRSRLEITGADQMKVRPSKVEQWVENCPHDRSLDATQESTRCDSTTGTRSSTSMMCALTPPGKGCTVSGNALGCELGNMDVGSQTLYSDVSWSSRSAAGCTRRPFYLRSRHGPFVQPACMPTRAHAKPA
eukprot:6207694-Pleurochrysis_carterae.AAC.7